MGFWKTYVSRKEADRLRNVLGSRPTAGDVAGKLFSTVKSAPVGAGRFIVSPLAKRVSSINSAVRSGTCPGCGKKMLKTSSDHYCGANCAMRFAQKFINDWQSIDKKNNTLYDSNGQNVNTKLHRSCGCNIHNTYHRCSKLDGERMDRV